MLYLLNLEQMEDRWIAHAPALPGCFSSAETREAAVAAAPQAIADHRAWLRAHGEEAPDVPVQVEVDEVHRRWGADLADVEASEVNAFFASDREPLTGPELAEALRLLDWNRADLMASIEGLSPDDLAREFEPGWSIQRILHHIGRAEWWYLDRLSLAFPREDVPEDASARLEKVRSYFLTVVPTLVGDDRLAETEMETWSPRKMLRRALWHERDHTQHILQFRQKLR